MIFGALCQKLLIKALLFIFGYDIIFLILQAWGNMLIWLMKKVYGTDHRLHFDRTVPPGGYFSLLWTQGHWSAVMQRPPSRTVPSGHWHPETQSAGQCLAVSTGSWASQVTGQRLLQSLYSMMSGHCLAGILKRWGI